MIDVFRKIHGLLNRREKRMFYLLTVLMVAVAFAELLGISALLVLLRVLSEPGLIQSNRYIAALYDLLGFSSTFSFQVFLAAGTFGVMMASLMVKAGGSYAIIRFGTMRGFTISSRLLQSYLHQPYTWFLGRNSADISKSVLQEVEQLVMRVFIPGLRMLGSVVLATTIIGFLLFVDPVVAITSAALIGGGYFVIYLRLRGRLLRLGVAILADNKERFRVTQEVTGGFKEVKLMGLEDSYVRRFNHPAMRRARRTALSQIMNELPRYALEALTFGVLISLVRILLLRSGGDLAGALPVLGIFAFSVMRLLPALQQIYRSLAQIRNGKAVLDHIHADHAEADLLAKGKPAASPASQRINITRELVLSGVSYAYPAAEKTALSDLSLRITAHTTVGIVGGTGAGKTTLIDLVLGLLTPDAGEISVDGTPITRDNVRAWQRTLGYVPQSIYLIDDTVAANIAFGVPRDAIDMDAVERAAKVAALHAFVMQEMPQAYQTMVGERGVRLSGGQRQRIGIARALYHDPSLLIMDEATSALDNITERDVMEAVQNIRADKTIILIAHRLSTVRNCDTIFLLENGRLASTGTYDELVARNATFRKMAANA